MQTIRDRIVAHFHQNPTSCVPELCSLLGVSQPLVQYHIKNLLQEEIIEPVSQKPNSSCLNESRGRPAKYYRIAPSFRPDNYQALANVLLSNITDEQIFLETAKKLSGNRPRRQQTLAMELKLIEEKLKPMNYDPHWEVHRDGIRLFFRNCPYFGLLEKYPQLCKMDICILENMLNMPVIKEVTLTDCTGQAQECIFLIKPPFV